MSAWVVLLHLQLIHDCSVPLCALSVFFTYSRKAESIKMSSVLFVSGWLSWLVLPPVYHLRATWTRGVFSFPIVHQTHSKSGFFSSFVSLNLTAV